MNVSIKPGRAKGTIAAPPSKSFAHRLMICAALAHGRSTVHGISQSQDMLATMDCISALGVKHTLRNGTLTIDGGLCGYADGTVFPCRESGSTLRFFLPIALIKPSVGVFTGTERLIERGISVYEKLFEEKGIKLNKDKNRITVSGALTSGDYTLPGNISSQFVSGLMFALPVLSGDSIIKIVPPVESRPYIDITIDTIKSFGVNIIEKEPNIFYIAGNQTYKCHDMNVEGDWSNAAALFALNSIGGDVSVAGLNNNSIQGDKLCVDALNMLRKPNATIDISDCPDLGPVLFATAAACNGAVFTGTRRLRIKESDRAEAMAQELAKFGIKCEVTENTVNVLPGELRKPTEILQSHNDHRIVMALSLLCSITGGEICGAEAINKSYPSFFDALTAVGLEVSYDN